MQKESRFHELIRLQQDSGLTVREFCSNQGIVPSTFYYWKKKLQRSTGKNDFIPPDSKAIFILTRQQEQQPKGLSTRPDDRGSGFAGVGLS